MGGLGVETGRLGVEMGWVRDQGWRRVGLGVEMGRFRGGDGWV